VSIFQEENVVSLPYLSKGKVFALLDRKGKLLPFSVSVLLAPSDCSFGDIALPEHYKFIDVRKPVKSEIEDGDLLRLELIYLTYQTPE
jgi:hypothetical protein